jgi:leucyl-tRNA synthetase
MRRYNPKEIEPKWQDKWSQDKIYSATDFDENNPKYVMLTEFPYPSGDGLHLGHVREYTLGDIMARFKRMTGHNVLYPMGYDAFGLPTENFAIKNKIAPQVATERNISNFRKQFNSLGFSFDWDRSFSTTDPSYFKWTQWLFLQFYKAGLAYQDETTINWCPKCKTGLANEEVVNGRHERCDTLVEKKTLKQWLLKITEYADRLIDGLKDIDYPSRVADQQINWIGRSKGAEVDFKIENGDKITVFTTRPDTLYGATFIVLAPEHPLVESITSADQKASVNTYIKAAQSKSEIERQDTSREKSGVFTGAYAINPVNGQKTPIWIADYVLYGYGTGAIMAVPAHDERDYEFASKFNLPIKQVVAWSEADDHNPPQQGMEEVERETVIVHLKDKSTGKFAILNWHESLEGITTAIMGGIEEGQTPEDAVRAEISEEAALDNISITSSASWITISRYCASHKNQNRKAITHAFLAEVDNLKSQGKIPESEQKIHTLNWVEKSNVNDTLTPTHQKYVWEQLWGEKPFTGEGEMINSGKYNGMSSSDAREKIVKELEYKGLGKEKTTFKLRDWIFSRQHYWGEPIPIIHCENCGTEPVPDNQLPVELPPVDHYEPTDTGESPLALIDDWVNVNCPRCEGPAKRETDTMPNWAGSSWYYLRYFDAHNDEKFADEEKLKYWGMVDMYLGGMEHTTLHLLYSRFWHQFFYDQGLVPYPEPYYSRRGQGIILAADGSKMSKSKGNVINPNEVIDAGYGADALRVSIAFIAPYDQTTPWNPEGVAGTYRFVSRLWNLTYEYIESKKSGTKSNSELLSLIHRTISRVSKDLHEMGFNTAVSTLMEYVNALYKLKVKDNFESKEWPEAIKVLLQLSAPFVPHATEELWEAIGLEDSIHLSIWPVHNEDLLISDTVKIVVQVNGKLRANIETSKGLSEEEAVDLAKNNEKVKTYIEDHNIKKTIYIPNKLINFVI